jgi:predicted nucleotidyltransferase
VHACPPAHPEAAPLLDLLRERISSILGPRLRGLYLTGSLVTGDFDPAVSDVDLLAVLESAPRRDELAALEVMHREIVAAHPGWINRVEVSYLSRHALRSYRTRTSTMAVTSPGEPFHTKPAGRDWMLNWWVVREYGVALLGPPPSAFIGPISPAEVAVAVREGVAWRLVRVPIHRGGQVFTALTLCRALHTIETGGFTSKPSAAAWAAEAMPEWAELIGWAVDWWQHHWYDPVSDHAATLPRVTAFVEAVATRIGPPRE